ncbi:MAG: MarR family transcriptional regulator [Kordiimonadales bacterium]|nr:MAG: MarR family transcriptional regulator [Kordiimonadales bacterium]
MTTRETILTELKKHGEARADELAAPLGLTPMAVRQHLYQLQEEGAVDCISKAQGRGRPAKLWKLTSKADVYFPDTHRDLTLDLIDSVRSIMGEEGLEKLLVHRSEKQLRQYKAATKSSRSLKDKLAALAHERSSEGYMADVAENEAGELLFIENHCPICEAAKACSGLCSKELSVFQDLFNEIAEVERSEHMIAGARRCAYKVTPKP